MDDDADMTISRRNVFGGLALAMLAPGALSASEVASKLAALDPITLHNLLRGIAFIEGFGDPFLDDDADALVDQIAQRLPEARMILAVHRAHIMPGYRSFNRDEDRGALGLLHKAVVDAMPVRFDYTDLEGQLTSRQVRPLILIHPPHGIQMFAWCDLRGAYRRFFVTAMKDVVVGAPGFAAHRYDLLAGLLDHEGIAA